MPKINQYIDITMVDGVNYVVNLSDNNQEYEIIGSPVLTSNWAIASPGGETNGMICRFWYKATPTLGSNHIYVFGSQLPDQLAAKNVNIHAIYKSGWTVMFDPDFEEIGIIDTADIMDDAVTNDKLANITRGCVKVGGASNVPTDLNAKSSGNILIGDGTDINSVAVTGDVTISGAGVTTIGANKVTNAKLAGLSRGYIKVGDATGAVADLNAKTSGYVLIGDGTDIKSTAITGDISITGGGVVTVNANGPWETGAGAGSVQTRNSLTGAVASGVEAIAGGHNVTSSGNYSVALGATNTASGQTSVCLGTGNTATDINTVAIGSSNDSTVFQAIAIGNSNNASSSGAVAIGSGNTSDGDRSVTIGTGNEINGDDSFAIGRHGGSNQDGVLTTSFGKFSTTGDSQKVEFGMWLTSDGSGTAQKLVDINGSDDIPIPTDCSCKIKVDFVSITKTSTGAPPVGTTYAVNIDALVKNLAGTLTIVDQTLGTPMDDTSIVVSPEIKISGTNIYIEATDANTGTMQFYAHFTMFINGFRNYAV